MHNLLRFYNEFSSLASAAGEPVEARTTASSLGLTTENGNDIVILLKSVSKMESISDGDLIMAFSYDKVSGKTSDFFFLGMIDIPSGNVINKSKFTAKKIHLKKRSVLVVNREKLTSTWYKTLTTVYTRENELIVVRKLNSEEIEDYHTILSNAHFSELNKFLNI